MTVNHPDIQKELEHLQWTLGHIRAEAEQVEARISDQKADLAKLRQAVMDEYAELMMREMMHRVTAQMQRELRLAEKKAYFTRIDFTPNGGGEREVNYIGKYGVLDSKDLEVVVVDWRSPVANLYYSGQVGQVSYVAPDGEIAGEMHLKRLLGVSGEEITSIFDTDIATQDVYLQSVLGAVTSDRLKEIVTTIQTEQNNIIRHNPRRNLIVQGVAGSGKTTIALHRIAYLLYIKRDEISPSNLMILAPNPLFLDYISAVLPDLGVAEVAQTTFANLTHQLLEGEMPKIRRDDRLDELAGKPGEWDRIARICRYKGSRAFLDRVTAFLERLERSLLPEGDIRFGPVEIFSQEALDRFYLSDLAKFPLRRRFEEIQKTLKNRVKEGVHKVRSILNEECDKRAGYLRTLAIPEEERRARMRTLYDSRDLRLKEVVDAAPAYIKTMAAKWPKLDLLKLYRMLWEEEGDTSADFLLAREHTLKVLSGGAIEVEDVAPVLLIAEKAIGLKKPDIRHIIIDEAQDFSALQIAMLRRIFPFAPQTLVGDLSQGVHAYRGLHGWDEADASLGGADYLTLRTSYRSTVEIVDEANIVSGRHPVPGQIPATPVLRHGDKPGWFSASSDAQRYGLIVERVEELRAKGFHSVAVIEKTRAHAAALFKKIGPRVDGLRLMNPEEGDYRGGLWVAAATDVKGLEFDCVLVAQAGDCRYEDTPMDARLLYVAITRALHRVDGVYTGERTPLLERR